MQSENFDNKIRQAAEQHHPEYDGKAWTKMEKLLDRHLPQKEDRRRRVIFFLLLFLLLGGGAWIIISKPWQPGNQTLTTTTANTEKKSANTPVEQATSSNSPVGKTGVESTNKLPDEDGHGRIDQTIPVEVKTTPVRDVVAKAGRNNVNAVKQNKSTAIQDGKTDQVTNDMFKPGKSKKDDSSSLNIPVDGVPATAKNGRPKENDSDNAISVPPVNNDATKKNDIDETKPAEAKINEVKQTAKKPASKKANQFFFSFSASPDVSSVGFSNPGKLRILTGGGFGYTFKERLTIRTGFYAGRKIYSAHREDYKPDVTPMNYQYIDNIAADCKVYEIPLMVGYNFNSSKKRTLFAAAGLSSFIMKKEKYVYNYKWPNGSTYSYTKSLHDEYSHYFSVLTLSAGYEYKINRTFSISAEPYVKLPLAGVGYGKVKLNSAGVMFSVNMSPFHRQ